MAQGPSDTILVAIRITLRIRESKVRNPDPRVVSRRASGVKMEMAEMGAPISLDGLAVHPDCWCVCLCYLHFAPENPEDAEMYLLVTAHPGCPSQSPESSVCVCVCVHSMH